MIDQHTWIITFNGNSVDMDEQANSLEEFLLSAASDVQVIQRPTNESAQGGWTDILITFITSSTAVALVNVISTWIKSTHGASIDIEIKDTNVKVRNVTERNSKEILREVLKHAQDTKADKEE